MLFYVYYDFSLLLQALLHSRGSSKVVTLLDT